MTHRSNCFVAYPSIPPSRGEVIEAAITEIADGGVVGIAGWRSLSVTGRVIINRICEAIRHSDIFIADVTGLNPNVLFELGYAIGLRKRVYLLLDPNIAQAKQSFDQFSLLTTVGYLPYSNSRDIVNGFYRDEPYSSLDKTIIDDYIGRGAATAPRNVGLLHLKPPINTQAAIAIARRAASSPLPSVIDDPQEIRAQTFSWYVQHVHAAFAVSCHLLSTEYKDWELHNSKNALVAGLAFGMGRPLLMLAHDPYVSPLDYRETLQAHKTAAQAESLFNTWLLPVVELYESQSAGREHFEVQERARGELREIAIGDPIAEYEEDQLVDYFIPTAAYNEALRSKHSIFVGRRGTGKTASLYKLSEELRSDPRNHVCVVKPVDYELQGLLAVLSQDFGPAERGYLVESLWKFLLYTELAKSVYEELLDKPPFYACTPAESALREFVDQNKALITPDFSFRLEAAVRRLREITTTSAQERQNETISEKLHSEMLARLRALLGAVLSAKAKVVILVDNLDKSWTQYTEIERLSDLVFGLLSVSSRVAQDFAKESHWRQPVNLNLTLFLRSDIYAAMVRFARERDKLPVRRIRWEDPGLLRRVVEQRFVESGAGVSTPDEIWGKYFVAEVGGVPLHEYLKKVILPRPRDMVFFIKSALEFAVNRGNTIVQEPDLVSAQEQYSRFALGSLVVEGVPQVQEIEELLMQFIRGYKVVTRNDVASAVRRAGIDETRLDDTIDLLIELTFLGPELAPDRFDFLYDEEMRTKFRVMAHQVEQESGKPARYLINTAFHAFLEVNSGAPESQMEIDLK